jgi:hypothetical protein
VIECIFNDRASFIHYENKGNEKGFEPGLPDDWFSNQKSQFGNILEGLAMENLCIFIDFLVYFVVIWNIFPRFGILDQKNLATLV